MGFNTEYFVGSEDGCSISFRKEETSFNGATVTISFRYIAMIIAIFAVFTLSKKYWPNIINSNKDVEIATSFVANEQGFVFEDSDTRLITIEEINALKNSTDYSFAELLALSRNELYARIGQVFNEDEFFGLYYGQYDWYKKTNKHNVSWSEFNDIEKANLRLIIAIEEEYGFRK